MGIGASYSNTNLSIKPMRFTPRTAHSSTCTGTLRAILANPLPAKMFSPIRIFRHKVNGRKSTKIANSSGANNDKKNAKTISESMFSIYESSAHGAIAFALVAQLFFHLLNVVLIVSARPHPSAYRREYFSEPILSIPFASERSYHLSPSNKRSTLACCFSLRSQWALRCPSADRSDYIRLASCRKCAVTPAVGVDSAYTIKGIHLAFTSTQV